METTPQRFITDLCKAIDDRLHAEEKTRAGGSLVVTDAAFESWLPLAILTVLRENRSALGLEDGVQVLSNLSWDSFACRNKRIELWTSDDDGPLSDRRTHIATIELKLIRNGKHWRGQVREVQGDMQPAAGNAGDRFDPTLGRFALVAVVGEVYQMAHTYRGEERNLEAWEKELWELMLGRQEGDGLTRVWSGTPLRIAPNAWMEPNVPHFFQLHALCTDGRR
jgi:hypothetical protein